MKLLKVYTIDGLYLGLLSVDQICQLFKDKPGLWISIHANREDWPETPSGEFNESSWVEWCELYGRPAYIAKNYGLYETLYELVSTSQSPDVSAAIKNSVLQHACCMLAIESDSTIQDVLELLQKEL